MASRIRSGKGGVWRVVGLALSTVGAVLVITSLPKWLWLLGLGVLLVWGGLLLAMGPR